MAETSKKLHLAEGQNPILSDKEIAEISEFTPFAEGDGVYYEDDGEFLCGFWGAAEEAAAAAPLQAAKLKTGLARALFHMRSFYFLGVLRGAEAYRSALIEDEDVPSYMPFALDAYSAEEFREDLETMPPEVFRRLCALLGLSVQWEDGPKE